uniref:Histone-lysine N-methyltransferase eggless n=1 Tax=Meloidogyne incognita TaxID=6306 RepID=A0A914KKF9_MELIC
MNEINQALSRVPDHKYNIETLVSDSSESDSENLEDDLVIFNERIKKWPNWLEQELSQANLNEHLILEENQFYFAPISKLNNEVSTNGYAKCKLIKKDSVGLCQVKGFLLSEDTTTTSLLQSSQLAMGDAPTIRCPEGTRVVALCKRGAIQIGSLLASYFEGTIAVKPFSQNRFEYLVFFDNGIDAYVKPTDIRLMFNQPLDDNQKFQPRLAFKNVVNSTRAEFIRHYLACYPDWPLIQLKKTENMQRILAIRNGLNDSAFVLDVDRQLALLRFPGMNKAAWPSIQSNVVKNIKDCVVINCKEHAHNDEWVYRGNPLRFPTLALSTNYNQHSTQNNNQNTQQNLSGRPLVRTGRKMGQFEMAHPLNSVDLYKSFQIMQEIRHQTARKSSKQQSIELPPMQTRSSGTLSKRKQLTSNVQEERIVIPKWIRPKNFHKNSGNVATRLTCSPVCLSSIKVTKYPDRYHSPYSIPLLNGWARLTLNLACDSNTKSSVKKYFTVKKKIVYKTPCGIQLSFIEQIAEYLQLTKQQNLSIDMFTFDPQVKPEIRIKLANVVLEDFTSGQEAIPIPLVNAVENAPLPDMIYRPRRTGIKRLEPGGNKLVEESISPFFCTGCTCIDDCTSDNCECRQLTIEAQNQLSESLKVPKSSPKGYNHRRLENKHISGIYECNSNCKCNRLTCFNRVVQQDLQIPLSMFMTADKGWGVRTLVDIPEGTFVCTYAGELIDEEVADSLQNDIYFADLDLIDVVEREKRQQGIDYITDEGYGDDEVSETQKSRNVSEIDLTYEDDDEAFVEPSTSQQLEENEPISEMDDQLRAIGVLKEPNVQKITKKKKVKPWKDKEFQDYFGKNFLFVVDAAKTGNIGRFLNHSCEPNCQIQHCLVDTHDLRFPWCAFFTTKFVKAGQEITWDYMYEIGSVANKVILCSCGSNNCRGRLL